MRRPRLEKGTSRRAHMRCHCYERHVERKVRHEVQKFRRPSRESDDEDGIILLNTVSFIVHDRTEMLTSPIMPKSPCKASMG